MPKILILDDSEERQEKFIEVLSRAGYKDLAITENAFKAIELLKNLDIDILYLDNDLGENNGTGLDVARFLVMRAEEYRGLEVIIHSWNDSAKTVMLQDLLCAGFLARASPFSPKMITLPITC